VKIGILSRNSELYSTKRLIEAVNERGHQSEVIDYLHCYISIEKGKPNLHYKNEKLNDFDAIIPRIGASFTFFGSAVVRQFEMMKVFSVNPSQAIVRSRDKLRTHQILSGRGVDMPSTGFARSPDVVGDVIKKVGGYPVILKLLEGTHGKGVVLVETKKQAESTLDAFYSLKTHILIQEFIAEAKGTDIRAFVVDNKVVGAMKRYAAEGDFRSNLHKGGYAKIIKLSKTQRDLAIKASQTLGLHVAGVDMIESSRGILVLEVNSSPGLEGIEKATNIDIAARIVEFIEKYAKTEKKRDKVGV